MSVISFVACLLNQHEPVRRHVTWNGQVYIGHCRHCDAPIQRIGRRNWRRQKSQDADGGKTT